MSTVIDLIKQRTYSYDSVQSDRDFRDKLTLIRDWPDRASEGICKSCCVRASLLACLDAALRLGTDAENSLQTQRTLLN